MCIRANIGATIGTVGGRRTFLTCLNWHESQVRMKNFTSWLIVDHQNRSRSLARIAYTPLWPRSSCAALIRAHLRSGGTTNWGYSFLVRRHNLSYLMKKRVTYRTKVAKFLASKLVERYLVSRNSFIEVNLSSLSRDCSIDENWFSPSSIFVARTRVLDILISLCESSDSRSLHDDSIISSSRCCQCWSLTSWIRSSAKT